MSDSEQKPSDESFPTLTEVMSVPRYSEHELPSNMIDVDWSELAIKVRENVFERLMRRSEVLLETGMQSTLQTITRRATESLASELEAALQQMIRDLVSKAVNEELTRLQTEIQRRDTNRRDSRS